MSGEHQQEELYVLKADEVLGPYSRDEIAKGLVDGSIGPDALVRIGPEGKPFPATAVQGDWDPPRLPR